MRPPDRDMFAQMEETLRPDARKKVIKQFFRNPFTSKLPTLLWRKVRESLVKSQGKSVQSHADLREGASLMYRQAYRKYQIPHLAIPVRLLLNQVWPQEVQEHWQLKHDAARPFPKVFSTYSP